MLKVKKQKTLITAARLALLGTAISMSAIAQTEPSCSDLFGSVLQSNATDPMWHAHGIEFNGGQSTVKNTYSTNPDQVVLPADHVWGSFPSDSLNSCIDGAGNRTSCIASGAPSASISLPYENLPAGVNRSLWLDYCFPWTWPRCNLEVKTSAKDFKFVGMREWRTVNFNALDGSVYHIKKLEMYQRHSTVKFSPGDYYIDQFVWGPGTTDARFLVEPPTVPGDDPTVRLFFKNGLQIPFGMKINPGGNAQNLFIYAPGGFQAPRYNQVNAYIYSNALVDLGHNGYFEGAFSAKKINVGGPSTVKGTGEVTEQMAAGMCSNTPPNTPPVAVASVTPELVTIGSNITLDGSASTDVDSTSGTNDDIVDFDWYLEDGAGYVSQVDDESTDRDETETLSSKDLIPGVYTVSLEVEDSAGETATDIVTFEVTAVSPVPRTTGRLNSMFNNICVAQSQAAKGHTDPDLVLPHFSKAIDLTKAAEDKGSITTTEETQLLSWISGLSSLYQNNVDEFVAQDLEIGCNDNATNSNGNNGNGKSK